MDREPGDGGAREVVHSETIRLGSSTLTASVSDWPLRADRSLDFTFEPAGGIRGRTGKLRMVSPSGKTGTVVGSFESGDEIRLPKYTRDNSVWGWLLGLLPWILLVPILGFAWTRTRQARRGYGRSWDAS